MFNATALIRRFGLALALVAALSATGCSKKQKADESGSPTGSTEENVLGDSDSGKAMGLQTIHFAYDSFVLTEEAKSAIKNNAQIMKDKASLKIQVEGHCDQRGGVQYNIALGEKRANAVKKFLVDQGVADNRLTTISYGKERLIDQSNSEEAHAKNRRANFVVTSR